MLLIPTDDGTSSSNNNLNDTLGELEGLLTAQQVDYLLVAGDFNTDVCRSSIFTKMLLDFADDHSLVFADLEFGEAVGWTFVSHSGKSHLWIDHVLISGMGHVIFSFLYTGISKINSVYGNLRPDET